MMFLENIKILDLSRILAGPLATQILGDMGADVLKIEPPQGDDTRTWGPPFQEGMSAYFQCCNRNKASLTLDLKKAEQRKTLYQLAEKADVVIANFTPGVKSRLGLDHKSLAQGRQDLITMDITGYGGNRSDEPGYDVMIQAESGLMGITGPENGEPYKVGVAVVDVLTGMMAANGILAALFHKQRTGKGSPLKISLYQTALFSLINVASNGLVSGEPAQRWGNQHPNIVPYQPFHLADRTWVIGTGNDTHYGALCNILKIDNPQMVNLTNEQRLQQRQTLLAMISDKLKSWSSESLVPLLKRKRIPNAPIMKPLEALQAVSRWDKEAIVAMEHTSIGTVRGIRNPIQSESMRQHYQPPPTLNEGGQQSLARWLK